jgi:hypothetical protein
MNIAFGSLGLAGCARAAASRATSKKQGWMEAAPAETTSSKPDNVASEREATGARIASF